MKHAVLLIALLLAGCETFSWLGKSPQDDLNAAKANYAAALDGLAVLHDTGVISDETLVNVVEPVRADARAALDAAQEAITSGSVNAAALASMAVSAAARYLALYERMKNDVSADPSLAPTGLAYRYLPPGSGSDGLRLDGSGTSGGARAYG